MSYANYYQPKWFPFNRIKPPDEGYYLVTIRNAIRATMLHFNPESNIWTDDNKKKYEVAAWMFLPGIYQPGDDE